MALGFQRRFNGRMHDLQRFGCFSDLEFEVTCISQRLSDMSSLAVEFSSQELNASPFNPGRLRDSGYYRGLKSRRVFRDI